MITLVTPQLEQLFEGGKQEVERYAVEHKLTTRKGVADDQLIAFDSKKTPLVEEVEAGNMKRVRVGWPTEAVAREILMALAEEEHVAWLPSRRGFSRLGHISEFIRVAKDIASGHCQQVQIALSPGFYGMLPLCIYSRPRTKRQESPMRGSIRPD